MQVQEIVMKLVGPVQPTGDSGEDSRRLGNLAVLCVVTDHLLKEIQDATSAENNHQASMKEISKFAADYLAEVRAGDRP